MARRKDEPVAEDREREKVITTIVVIVAAVLTAALIIALTKLWQSVTARREFLVQPALVTLESGGQEAMVKKWVRVEEMKRDFLRTDTSRVLSNWHSIFKGDLTGMTRDAYLSSPWVRDVVFVRKVFPNRLDIELQLREPFAVAQFQGKYFIVDADGMLLDLSVYLLTPENNGTLLPAIHVPEGTKWPGGTGRFWSDPCVLEGLSMLKLCREQFAGKVAIKQIEVTPEKAGTGLVPVRATLVLAAGPRVDWGRTPTSPTSVAEVPAYQKASNLLAIVAREKENIRRFQRIVVWETTPRVE
jgi:hypothetical protein